VLSSDPNPAARRGYALALGHLFPNVFFRPYPSHLVDVVSALVKVIEIEVSDKPFFFLFLSIKVFFSSPSFEL
jgi:hypothetical protein